ncbi:MAG: DMT family transporter [Desulfarculaceae bacterium]|nr:DMT family transporter [Desulfarculaceae bacterium]MCF8072130.1 DMT family transporter [Desulfarculaceae bacterium]MCF8100051.1 DMT family transporter [Desulfarculaceae bacterium]MCF8118258.1 DMT family transporter [Desulfarculaceae bacterium]
MPEPNQRTPAGAAVNPPPPLLAPLAFLLAGAALISFSGVMVKLTSVGPGTSAFYRMLIGGLGLSLWALWRGQRFWAGWPVLGGALLAGFFIALDLFLWHRSILYVGPGLATILANFQVFVVGLVGVLYFRERPGWRLAVAIPLAMAGLWGLVGSSWPGLGPSARLGVGLGLAAACAYSGYLLTLRWSVRRAGGLKPEANMALVSLACALILLPDALQSNTGLAVPSLADWVWLLIYGLACHALGWAFISLGLMRLPASRAGLVLLLQPTLAFVWDVLFFGRPTTWLEAGGALLAVAAIYLGSQSRTQ